MDSKAEALVRDYIWKHLDKSDPKPCFKVFTVWKCKILQNWKYLISSTLFDGMYYEVTYNGDAKTWYLDAYKKFENVAIPETRRKKSMKFKDLWAIIRDVKKTEKEIEELRKRDDIARDGRVLTLLKECEDHLDITLTY